MLPRLPHGSKHGRLRGVGGEIAREKLRGIVVVKVGRESLARGDVMVGERDAEVLHEEVFDEGGPRGGLGRSVLVDWC